MREVHCGKCSHNPPLAVQESVTSLERWEERRGRSRGAGARWAEHSH